MKAVFSIVSMLLATGLFFMSDLQAQSTDAAQYLHNFSQAEGQYNRGRDIANIGLLDEAIGMYEKLCRRLEDEGLAERYAFLYQMARYKIGWCWFRKYEIADNSAYLTEAQGCFDDFLVAAPDSIALLGAYMGAEARLRLVTSRAYEHLVTGDLGGSLPNLKLMLSEAKDRFDRVAQRYAYIDGPMVRAGALIRSVDVAYALSKVTQAASGVGGSSASALPHFEAVGYQGILPRLPTDLEAESDAVRGVVNYSQAVLEMDKALITDNSTSFITARNLMTFDVFACDGNLRRGIATLASGANAADAITMLRAASSRDGLVEASYWLGRAYLIQCEFPNARNSFDAFLNGTSDADIRLKRLREQAQRMVRVIRIAQGDQRAVQEIDRLPYEDLKIILRVAALAKGNELTRIVAAVDALLKDPVRVGGDQEMTDFFRGLFQSLKGEAAIGSSNRRAEFGRAAPLLQRVNGDYGAEAKYIRARALFFAGDFDQARPLLKDLVNTNHSLRALFYIGEIYRERKEFGSAKLCYEVMSTTLQNSASSADTRYWVNKAEGGIRALPLGEAAGGGIDDLNLTGIRHPDNLLSISGEVVSYETLAEFDAVKAKWCDETREQFAIWGFPKLSIYPSPAGVQRSSLGKLSFGNLSAQICDQITMNEKWNLRLRVISQSEPNGVSGCSVSSKGRPLPFRSGYYCNDGLPFDAPDVLTITGEKLYPSEWVIPAQGISDFDTTIVVSTRPDSLHKCSEGADLPAGSVARPRDCNYVMAKWLEGKLPAAVNQILQQERGLRDIAYDSTKDRFLVVSADQGNALAVYSAAGGKQDIDFALAAGQDMAANSPEGIAIDRDGNIYLADWGNHRVIVFDGESNYRFEFGRPRGAGEENAGAAFRLTFPTRIAFEEDAEGVTVAENGAQKTYYRETHILVADRYGIHRFDSRGRYLDTPISAEAMPSGRGSLYSFLVTGYGEKAKMAVVDRISGKVRVFASRCE